MVEANYKNGKLFATTVTAPSNSSLIPYITAATQWFDGLFASVYDIASGRTLLVSRSAAHIEMP